MLVVRSRYPLVLRAAARIKCPTASLTQLLSWSRPNRVNSANPLRPSRTTPYPSCPFLCRRTCSSPSRARPRSPPAPNSNSRRSNSKRPALRRPHIPANRRSRTPRGKKGPGQRSRILHALRPGRRKASRAQNAAEISEPAAGARPAAIVVVLDLVLSLINRPFAFLSPGARHVVGLVAIVTLAIAAVTAALAPLAPKNDAVTFIRQKRAELDQPPPPPAAQSEKPQAENAHGAGH